MLSPVFMLMSSRGKEVPQAGLTSGVMGGGQDAGKFKGWFKSSMKAMVGWKSENMDGHQYMTWIRFIVALGTIAMGIVFMLGGEEEEDDSKSVASKGSKASKKDKENDNN